MTCISEQKIARLLSDKTSATKMEMEHLLRCDRCRGIYLTLAELNQHFVTGVPAEWSARTDVRLRFKDSNIIMLEPVTAAMAPEKSVYRLVAMGGASTEPYLLFAFSNEAEGLLGRVLQERETGIVKFYLIGESMDKVQGLQVELDDCGLDGVTDLNGVIDFGRQGELRIRNVRVKTPLTVISLSQMEERSVESEKHIFTVKNPQHDEVIIEIDRGRPRTRYHIRCSRKLSPAEDATLQVVAVTDRRTLVGFPEHGVTVLETDDREKVLKIHIY